MAVGQAHGRLRGSVTEAGLAEFNGDCWQSTPRPGLARSSLQFEELFFLIRLSHELNRSGSGTRLKALGMEWSGRLRWK